MAGKGTCCPVVCLDHKTYFALRPGWVLGMREEKLQAYKSYCGYVQYTATGSTADTHSCEKQPSFSTGDKAGSTYQLSSETSMLARMSGLMTWGGVVCTSAATPLPVAKL